MELETIKNQFLSQYIMSSDKTKLKYEKEVNMFLNICDITSIAQLDNLGESELQKFYKFSKENNWSPSTINQRLGTAKLFSSWAFKKKIISRDVLEDIKRIRTTNKVHYTPSSEECERLLNYIKNHKDTKRLYLMTKLMLNSGLRRMEICNLKIQDINKENCSIKVNGKGKKIIEQPISSSVMGELIDYINTERKSIIDKYIAIGGTDKGFVFLSGIGDNVNTEQKNLLNGNQVSDNAFYQQVKRYAKLSGIENWDKITVHSLRRHAGTEIYNNTGDIKLAQEFLRHSNVSTTEQCYVDFNRNKVKEAVNNLETYQNDNAQDTIDYFDIQRQTLSKEEEYKLYLMLSKKFSNVAL